MPISFRFQITLISSIVTHFCKLIRPRSRFSPAKKETHTDRPYRVANGRDNYPKFPIYKGKKMRVTGRRPDDDI